MLPMTFYGNVIFPYMLHALCCANHPNLLPIVWSPLDGVTWLPSDYDQQGPTFIPSREDSLLKLRSSNSRHGWEEGGHVIASGSCDSQWEVM